MGIEIEPPLNEKSIKGNKGTISGEMSRVKVYVIPTNEELLIARDTARLIC